MADFQDIYNYAPDYGQEYASEVMRVERDDGGHFEFDTEYFEDGTRVERDFEFDVEDDAATGRDYQMDMEDSARIARNYQTDHEDDAQIARNYQREVEDGARIARNYQRDVEDGARIVRDYQTDVEDGARIVRDYTTDVEDGARIERDFKFDLPDDIMVDEEIDLKEFDVKDVEIISPNEGEPIVIFAGTSEPGVKHHDPIERSDLPCDAKEKIIKGKPHAIVHRQSPILIRRPPTYVKIEHEPLLLKQNPIVFYQHPSMVKQPIIHKHLPQKVQYQPYVVKVEQPIEKKILLEKNKIEKPCHHHHHHHHEKIEVPKGYSVKEIFPEDVEAELKIHQ